MMSTHIKTDVAVVGAGLVGLAAALAFNHAGYEVLLIDSKQPEVFSGCSTDWDQRIYAISPKNAEWLTRLGAWQLLDMERVTEMQAMEIWGDDVAEPLQLSADDANADVLGFIVEERALKQALLQSLQAGNVKTIYGISCTEIKSSAQHSTLRLNDQTVVESTLLLAADGVNSWVRQQLGIAVQQKPYHQTAIVANFSTEKSHGNIARQWFTQDTDGHVGIMAWLPLLEKKVSIVWSVSTQYAETLLKLDEDDFTRQVMAVGDSTLGTFKLITSPAAFPLVLKKAGQMVKDSIVLVGDAAHRVHPMAGQGVNLGFRDVIDLLDDMESRNQYASINDIGLLAHYARRRKADLHNMTTLTNGLYHLFESQNYMLKKVRNFGLLATNHQVVRKRLVTSAISL